MYRTVFAVFAAAAAVMLALSITLYFRLKISRAVSSLSLSAAKKTAKANRESNAPPAAGVFKVEFDITFIHTDEIIA